MRIWENVFGRPNAFADSNALSVYTAEHERYYKASEMCTTSVTRAQLLWNVHNISETATYRIFESTGWRRRNTL